MMEMSTWKRGYEQIPDVRTMEKELGESRKHTSPLWKYLAIGAIPILTCGVLALAVFAGVLSLGLVILHDRCPPAQIPVARAYFVDLDIRAQSPRNWTNRAGIVTALNSYLQSVAANKSIVYSNAFNPLVLRIAHTSKEVYNRLFNEIYYDTPDNAIAKMGGSLRVRSFISSSGNGVAMAGKTIVEYIFRSGDQVIATESAIDPSASQSDAGKERLEFAYSYVPEMTTAISRYEHHVEVTNIVYQYAPKTISDIMLLFDRVDHVLPNVPSTTALNVTSNHYVWEQSYANDGIGPTDALYPQTLETHLQFIYPTQLEAQAGTTLPSQGTLTFRMWMGIDGLGRWDHDTIDMGMTLFHTVASSWDRVAAALASPSPSPSPAASPAA